MSGRGPTIRRATVADLDPICAIYAHEVETSTSTLDTEPWSVASRTDWLEEHTGPYRVCVVDDAHRGVVAWGKISRWSPKKGYDPTVEVSLFVDAAARGEGLGRQLLLHLLAFARDAGHRVVIGRIVAGNAASLGLFTSLGFETVGTMREVGLKFGRRLDVVVVQKILL